MKDSVRATIEEPKERETRGGSFKAEVAYVEFLESFEERQLFHVSASASAGYSCSDMMESVSSSAVSITTPMAKGFARRRL